MRGRAVAHRKWSLCGDQGHVQKLSGLIWVNGEDLVG